VALTSVPQVYASHVVALQQLLTARLGRNVKLPFLVMTSDDTHELIDALLQQHAHYGLAPSQVTLHKQQKV
jgi:UDP-sugar pyrophosphorylase